MNLNEFASEQKVSIQDIVRDYKGRMFDSYYDINNMVEAEMQNMKKRNEERMKTIIIEAERKALEERELPAEIADMLKRFQGLINSLYERSLRVCLQRSLILLDEQYTIRLDQFYDRTGINPLEKSIEEISYEDLFRYQQAIEYEKVDDRIPFIKVKNSKNKLSLFLHRLHSKKERIRS